MTSFSSIHSFCSLYTILKLIRASANLFLVQGVTYTLLIISLLVMLIDLFTNYDVSGSGFTTTAF